MDNQIIEEMAKVVCTHKIACKDCTEYDFGYCSFLGWCTKLYNAGYRKLPEIVKNPISTEDKDKCF